MSAKYFYCWLSGAFWTFLLAVPGSCTSDCWWRKTMIPLKDITTGDSKGNQPTCFSTIKTNLILFQPSLKLGVSMTCNYTQNFSKSRMGHYESPCFFPTQQTILMLINQSRLPKIGTAARCVFFLTVTTTTVVGLQTEVMPWERFLVPYLTPVWLRNASVISATSFSWLHVYQLR